MKHLYIDGGVTIQGVIEAGLIRRLTITRIPVLLGSGTPLFGPLSQDIRLEHVATRSYPSGMVQSEYVISLPHVHPFHGRSCAPADSAVRCRADG
jgi:dihydrofolate reductase